MRLGADEHPPVAERPPAQAVEALDVIGRHLVAAYTRAAVSQADESEPSAPGETDSEPRRPGRSASPSSLPVVSATIALSVLVAAVQGSAAAAVLRGVLVLVVVPCALIDLERRIIPNRITGPAAIVAIVAGLALDTGGEPRRLLAGALTGGFLLLAALAKPAGMGMGDVKLLGTMGLFLGPAVVVALFVALIASTATGVLVARRHGLHAARKTALPFGPYLAAGGILAALVGNPIVHAWLHLHG